MSNKPSNIPSFTAHKTAKTIGIIKNSSNNKKVISDPTLANVDRQLATTVLKRVSFYVPENQCNNISTKVNSYPKDKYVTSILKNESQCCDSNSLGSKLGNKIDGVIKMGCKLTNKLDNVIRPSGKFDKYETPKFEIRVDSSKDSDTKSQDKKKNSYCNKLMDIDKNYSLKWDSKKAKMYTPMRNSEDDIVLNNYKVYSNKDGSKKSILHSLKYTSHDDNNDLVKDKWLWDIISNRKINEDVSDEANKEKLLDGFDIFCQQMAQGAGSKLVDVLVNTENVLDSELIKDYKGSGNDILQQGQSLYVLPPTIANSDDLNDQTSENNDIKELFVPLGKGIWRWANSSKPIKETKCRFTQTEDEVDSIILDTSLGPGFEFVYSTNSNEIYQLQFQDNINNILNEIDYEEYNLSSTTQSEIAD